MNANSVVAGTTTSEFKLSLAGIIASLVMALLRAFVPDFPDISEHVASIAAIVVAYIGGRSYLKGQEQKQLAQTEPIKLRMEATDKARLP